MDTTNRLEPLEKKRLNEKLYPYPLFFFLQLSFIVVFQHDIYRSTSSVSMVLTSSMSVCGCHWRDIIVIPFFIFLFPISFVVKPGNSSLMRVHILKGIECE